VWALRDSVTIPAAANLFAPLISSQKIFTPLIPAKLFRTAVSEEN
jgi:hypothetical protein